MIRLRDRTRKKTIVSNKIEIWNTYKHLRNQVNNMKKQAN